MKTLIKILFIICLCIPFVASAQWTDGGSYIRTDDNVCVGVSSNSFPLYVRKDDTSWQGGFVNQGGTGTTKSAVYLAHGAGYGMHIRGYTTDGKYTLQLYNANAQTNIFYNNGIVGLGLVGNVGIGTNAPIEKLHVNGSVHATGSVKSVSRKFYFGEDQLLEGDGNSKLYWRSNNSLVAQFILRDPEGTYYGRLYGDQNGAQFGLLDGDGNWSYLAAKDNYTAFRINDSEKMRILANGNVGIGTNTPNTRLHVSGAVRAQGASYYFGSDKGDSELLSASNGFLYWVGAESSAGISITSKDQDVTYARIGGLDNGGDIALVLADGVGNNVLASVRDDYTSFSVSHDEVMRLTSNGNVGIGTATPDNALDVNGTIRAKEIICESGWSDYVFYDDYKLPTLEEEDQHIEEKGHLLGFKSEEDMGGEISVGEVSRLQQAKIEEIMLHLIEMDKEIKQLQKENEQLRVQISKGQIKVEQNDK